MSRLEEIISGASRAGWDWFDQLDPKVKELVTLQREENAEKATRIAKAWARFAESADGAEALEAMFVSTLDRTVWFVQLGEDVNPHGKWGYFREGQNALAHEIRRQIAAGREKPQPKPRDR